MHILDGAEGLLPQLELNRGVELRETRVEVVLERIGVGEVDRVLLVRVLCDVGQVQTECFAETAELDFALVFEAEFECLLSDLLLNV
jgi:hypothetical protein